MTTNTQGWSAEDLENDVNVVALWTKVDLVRWAAGLVSGWIAGFFAIILVGGGLSVLCGHQFLFALKVMGIPIVGNTATDFHSVAGIWAGAGLCAFIFGLWGFVYGHFVRSNRWTAFLGMGFTWMWFLWVFNWNLMLQSFKQISWARVSPGSALLVCAAYGFGMSVIGIVDPLFRRIAGKSST